MRPPISVWTYCCWLVSSWYLLRSVAVSSQEPKGHCHHRIPYCSHSRNENCSLFGVVSNMVPTLRLVLFRFVECSSASLTWARVRCKSPVSALNARCLPSFHSRPTIALLIEPYLLKFHPHQPPLWFRANDDLTELRFSDAQRQSIQAGTATLWIMAISLI